MVSWRGAFKGALVTLLWSIVWIIIGLGIIITAGLFGGVRFVGGPSGIGYPQAEPVIMIPATIIGVFIIGLGWMAAFYKMQHEIMAGTAGGSSGPGAVRRQTVICPSCGAENMPNSKYCINCGAQMK